VPCWAARGGLAAVGFIGSSWKHYGIHRAGRAPLCPKVNARGVRLGAMSVFSTPDGTAVTYVTVVHTDACHFCEDAQDAQDALAEIARELPLRLELIPRPPRRPGPSWCVPIVRRCSRSCWSTAHTSASAGYPDASCARYWPAGGW